MKAEVIEGATGASVAHPTCGINVLMLYENLATGNRVMRLFDALVHRCGREVSFQSDMWKFDILTCPSMGRLAAEDAVKADLIIVSAHGDESLEESVQSWFRAWTGHRGKHAAALVAVLNHTRHTYPVAQETKLFLEEMARAGRMEFFAIVTEEEELDLPLRREANSDDKPPAVLESLCRKNAHPSEERFEILEEAERLTHGDAPQPTHPDESLVH